ncbi:MAG: AI-2E family transporter, partial [Candidatus Uhrbacteria bacterium]|nr:AI-2E family transporter [Candidatus Uhrbacteria bacterium]
PNPILWGAVMAFVSVIPAVGPFLVWLPAGLFLLAIGSLVPALIVLIGGAVVISSVDNILRPILVGRDTQMPDALVFISILGGISVFGLTGVIIGPVIAALVLTIWDLFAEEFSTELTAQG